LTTFACACWLTVILAGVATTAACFTDTEGRAAGSASADVVQAPSVTATRVKVLIVLRVRCMETLLMGLGLGGAVLLQAWPIRHAHETPFARRSA
jgi:hypothetical protein